MRHLVILLLVASIAGAVTSPTGLISPTTTTPSVAASQAFPSANVLFCLDWVPMMGITNATKLAWKVDGGSTTSGVAIYANGGGTQLATGTTTGTGLQTVTGLSAFSLTAGGLYRTCWCATSASTFVAAAIRMASISADPVQDMFNFFGNHVGTANNPCVAGVPPAITGPLTPTPGQALVVYIAKE